MIDDKPLMPEEEAYLALLRLPHGLLRVNLQGALCRLRYEIAQSRGEKEEQVQNEFEALALAPPQAMRAGEELMTPEEAEMIILLVFYPGEQNFASNQRLLDAVKRIQSNAIDSASGGNERELPEPAIKLTRLVTAACAGQWQRPSYESKELKEFITEGFQRCGSFEKFMDEAESAYLNGYQLWLKSFAIPHQTLMDAIMVDGSVTKEFDAVEIWWDDVLYWRNAIKKLETGR